MTRPGSPVRAILAGLRAGLAQPRGADLSPLVPLVRQALAFIDRGDADDTGTAGDASELAFMLAALLEVGDEHFARQVFGLLFRLGVEGEVLAVMHLEKRPEDQATALLEVLRDEEKLLFANAFFRRPRPSRPKTARFCRDVIADVVERVPDELLILLELLANRHEYPALPLRNALVRGRLGMWLHRLLEMDLSAEQIRFLARVIGRLREPSLIERLAARLDAMDEVSAETVCRALAETPGVDPAVAAAPLAALFAVPEPSLTAAALAALGRCDPARAGEAAAGLLAAAPQRAGELAPFLAALSHAAFAQVLRALPATPRAQALAAVYAVLAAAVPRTMAKAARATCSAAGIDRALVRELAADLTARGREAARPLPPKPPLPEPVTVAEEPGGFWRRVKSLAGNADAAPPANDKAEALSRILCAGGAAQELQAQWLELDGATVADIAVSRSVFRESGFAGTRFANASFTDCQFTDVRFEEARFSGVTFRGCRFHNCRFSGSVLENVTFEQCKLNLCAFAGVNGENVSCEAVTASECDFFNAALGGLSLARCEFRAVSLVRAVLQRFSGRGAVFSDCLFEMAVFAETDLYGVRTRGCYFAGSRFSGATDEPDILGAMAKDAAGGLAETESLRPLPPALAQKAGLRLIAACCDAALFSRDVARRWRAFLANNKRRLSWARRRYGRKGAFFCDMLPLLIEAPRAREATGARPAPGARIAGFHPDLATMRHSADYWGDSPEETAKPPSATPPIPIASVCAVGATGSVAQSDDSVLDVLVCLEDTAATRPDLPAFREKLETIRQQALAVAGLALRFSCVSVADLRRNIFGPAEETGCEAALGRLRKEHCCRTAVVLAGKKPAWWCVAPCADQVAYTRTLAGIARTEPEIAADMIDWGGVRVLPGDASGDAALWLLMDAAADPFKGLVTLGLLEKHAAAPAGTEPLCETLKRSICANQGGFWRCDPYALLFREVTRHYRTGGQPGAAEVLRQAFLQKTGFDPCEEYTAPDGDTLLDHYFPYAPPTAGVCPPPPKREPEGDADSFAAAAALAQAITVSLQRACARLAKRDPNQAGGGDDERGRAMLTRRIAACFGQKVGKILRQPFVRPGYRLFGALEIGYEAISPKEKSFVLRGEGKGAHGARACETVRQDASLPRLCAWMAANAFHRPGMPLRGVSLPAPLVLADVDALLAAVCAQFPVRETFDPPPALVLAPPRVSAALIVANLLTPREQRRTLQADVLYATTWGELFHLERATDMEMLNYEPERFLSLATGLEPTQGLRLAVHTPAGSHCPAGQ
jgi:adenylate cyclase class 1